MEEEEELMMQQLQSDPISVTENHIYFYGAIHQESCRDLNRILTEMDRNLISQLLTSQFFDTEEMPVVHLHLSTDGGEFFAAVSTIQAIRNMKCKVHVHIEGFVASAGTLIASVCSKRIMGEYSKMLVHQMRSGHSGKFDDIEDNHANCVDIMNDIKEIYLKYTDFEESVLIDLLSRERYLSAHDCLEYGLVDVIID